MTTYDSNNGYLFNQVTVIHAAEILFALKDSCTIYTFSGPLGAGKTTLIKMLLSLFGVPAEQVVSPTFNYVNSYHTQNNITLYHFDLYRLHSLQEFINAGFDELLHVPSSWAFIEWPDIISPLLTHKVCHVILDYHDTNQQRKMTYTLQS